MYVDPGSGSMVVQILFASIAGAVLLGFRKINAALRKLLGKAR